MIHVTPVQTICIKGEDHFIDNCIKVKEKEKDLFQDMYLTFHVTLT